MQVVSGLRALPACSPRSSAPGCEHLPAPACNWVGLLCLCSGPALLVSLPLTVCPEPVARDVP